MPMPIDALFESITATGHTSSRVFAAICADCIVADMRDDRLMHTMPSAPLSQAAEGRLERADRRRGGLGQDLRVREPLPERLGRELDPVDELVVAESDRQRNDLDAELFRRARAGDRTHCRSRFGLPFRPPGRGSVIRRPGIAGLHRGTRT